MPDETGKRSLLARGFAIVFTFGVCGVVVVVALVGFSIRRTLTDFDSHRGRIGLNAQLAVSDESLRFSPGMDSALWCKFDANVGSIADVFDPAAVDTRSFNEQGFDFNVRWIEEPWWDVDSRELIGGEVQVKEGFMRVAYKDHGDRRLTVYIFWFEV